MRFGRREGIYFRELRIFHRIFNPRFQRPLPPPSICITDFSRTGSLAHLCLSTFGRLVAAGLSLISFTKASGAPRCLNLADVGDYALMQNASGCSGYIQGFPRLGLQTLALVVHTASNAAAVFNNITHR
jgi:hypothetical protein